MSDLGPLRFTQNGRVVSADRALTSCGTTHRSLTNCGWPAASHGCAQAPRRQGNTFCLGREESFLALCRAPRPRSRPPPPSGRDQLWRSKGAEVIRRLREKPPKQLSGRRAVSHATRLDKTAANDSAMTSPTAISTRIPRAMELSNSPLSASEGRRRGRSSPSDDLPSHFEGQALALSSRVPATSTSSCWSRVLDGHIQDSCTVPAATDEDGHLDQPCSGLRLSGAQNGLALARRDPCL